MYRTSERTSLSRKMAELEDRWRKSQEDRYILELKFKEVLQGLADKNEGSKLLKIREKYYRFLENEDRRNERNDQILRVLDKIESQANMFAAKTERLRLLKLHYEAYTKRMYPVWKTDIHEEEGLSSKSKERGYSSYKQEKGNVLPYTSSRREENVNYNLPRQTPRYSEKTYYPPNDIFHEGNLDAGNVMQSKSKSEKNRYPAINHGIYNLDLNSDDKSRNSHRVSIEQEENTSKDLLNVSLSDDNPVDDSTIPVEIGKYKVQNQNGDERSFVGKTETKEVPEKSLKFRVNPNDDYFTDKSDNSNVYLDKQMKESISNDSVDFRRGQYDAKLDARNGRSKPGNLSEKEWDLSDASVRAGLNEKTEVCGYSPEFKPSVVVTQPSPDIGTSSSEEGIPAEDNKINRQSSLPSREPSGVNPEPEVSDGEQVESRSGDDVGKFKYSPDEALSPRPTTVIDDAGGNVDDPFQFSSSDAELENQMAAMVERKRNDKSIPKVLGGSSFQKPREGEHQTNEALSVDDGHIQQSDVPYSVEEEINHPSEIRDDMSDASAENQNVVRNEESANKLIEPVDREIDDQEVEPKENQLIANKFRGDLSNVREQERNENIKIIASGKDMKSDDSEKYIEAGGSSIDINSEILDEDQNMSGDVPAHQTEESRDEVRNSNLADVENTVADAERDEEENAHRPDKVADEYDHRRRDDYEEGEELVQEVETMDEVENEARKYLERGDDGNKYDETSESNRRVERNENLEEFAQSGEEERVKYVEDEREVADEISEQRYEEQRDDDEVFEEVQAERIDRRNREMKDVEEEKESDVLSQGRGQSEEIEREEWASETYNQEGVVGPRGEEGNHTGREVEEEEFGEEENYERQGVTEEQDDGGRYERRGAVEEQDEERQYKRHDTIEETEEEREYERDDAREEPEEEGQFERRDTIEEKEEEREYERDDAREEPEEEGQYERQVTIAEQEEGREYERQDTREEPEEEREYERHETIEEPEERKYERQDTREEPEEEREYERQDTREEPEEREYERHETIEESEESEYERHEKIEPKEEMEYERQDTREEPEEREYERHETIEEPEEEREYERHETIEEPEEEREYERHETIEEPEEEREYERRETIEEPEEEREYERHETIEEQDEERHDTKEAEIEQREYERYAEEEQGKGRNERHDAMEEENQATGEQDDERYEGSGALEEDRERHEVKEQVEGEKERHAREGEKVEYVGAVKGDRDREEEEEGENVEESGYIRGNDEKGREEHEELTEESQEVCDMEQMKQNDRIVHVIEEEVEKEESVGQHKESIEGADKDMREEIKLSEQHDMQEKQDDLKSDDILPSKEIIQESENSQLVVPEEIHVDQPEKDVAGGEEKTITVKRDAASVEVKDVKKQPAVASSHPVEKPERNVKESSNVSGRPLTRQFGKKEYDPHKVEKLKSTIRKFQLKKDSSSKLDKTGRKQAESKK